MNDIVILSVTGQTSHTYDIMTDKVILSVAEQVGCLSFESMLYFWTTERLNLRILSWNSN